MSGFRKTKMLCILMVALFLVVLAFSVSFARNKDGKVKTGPGVIKKPLVANTHISTVANLWTVLSNYGWIGDDSFDNPSFEWPGGSGNHYLYQGSIWVAGRDATGVIHCTAGDEEEFTRTLDANDVIYFFDAADSRFQNRPNVNPLFAGQQVSAEDTYAEYTDLDIEKHNVGDLPLGIKVLERTYKWTSSYNDDFIIFDYQIVNIGLDSDGEDPFIGEDPETISDVYIAVRFDADVSFLGGGEYWYDDLTAYYQPKQISYLYDGDDPDVPGNDIGEFGASTGYIYARLLHASGGTSAVSYSDPVSHSWWTIDDDPDSEGLKFSFMSTPNYAGIPASPYDYRFLQAVGPFELGPLDTVNVVWALGVGDGLEGVILDSDWAKRIFDAGYLAATAPNPPTLSVELGDGFVKLGWDNAAEQSVDPLNGEQDFEGYRIYKSRRVDEAGSPIWIKLADYDKVNAIGANTGLQYEFTDTDVLNGYGYSYAVTAYDRGAPEQGLGALESSRRAESAFTFLTISAPPPTNVDDIYVYPNPFVGSAEWDHVLTFLEPFKRKLVFANLPRGEVKIKIFTLAGDLVETIEQTNTDQSIAIWDLITRNEQAAVSGIYLYTVESDYGTHIGKFVIIQ